MRCVRMFGEAFPSSGYPQNMWSIDSDMHHVDSLIEATCGVSTYGVSEKTNIIKSWKKPDFSCLDFSLRNRNDRKKEALQTLYEATKMAAVDVYQAFWTNCSKMCSKAHFTVTFLRQKWQLSSTSRLKHNILRARSSLLTFSYRSACITCFVALAGCRPTQLCPDAFGHSLVAAMPPGNQLRVEGRADLFSLENWFCNARYG